MTVDAVTTYDFTDYESLTPRMVETVLSRCDTNNIASVPLEDVNEILNWYAQDPRFVEWVVREFLGK
jgi:hypothetical protein